MIRWSAASTSSGGSSQPISAALPESSAHRSTRASFAAASRRSFAFSGAASITAWAMAARSPPGVSRAARSRTLSSAARAPASSSRAVARAMISALYRVMVPSSSAAAVPGSRVPRVWARSIRSPARPRDSPSAYATWSAVNSASGGAGLRRASSAETASLRAAAWASTRSHAHSTPTSSASGHPGEPAVLARGGVSGDRQARAAGQHVQRHPRPERGRRAGRLAGEDPRRAGLAGPPPPGGGRLHGEHLIGGGLADLGELVRG